MSWRKILIELSGPFGALSQNKQAKLASRHPETKMMKIEVAQRGGRCVCDAIYSNANEAGRVSQKGDARDGDQHAVIIGIACRPLGAAHNYDLVCRNPTFPFGLTPPRNPRNISINQP